MLYLHTNILTYKIMRDSQSEEDWRRACTYSATYKTVENIWVIVVVRSQILFQREESRISFYILLRTMSMRQCTGAYSSFSRGLLHFSLRAFFCIEWIAATSLRLWQGHTISPDSKEFHFPKVTTKFFTIHLGAATFPTRRCPRRRRSPRSRESPVGVGRSPCPRARRAGTEEEKRIVELILSVNMFDSRGV